MNLDEAIEILTAWDKGQYACDAVTFRKAVGLGLEALNAVRLCRNGVSAQVYLLLPGETED